MRKRIFITKKKNPNLYKVLLRHGGTAKFNSVTMTINPQPSTFFEKLLNKLTKLLTKKYE